MTYGTLNVDQVTNSDGITSGGLYGFKNRIINGAMMIDQRNAGASVATSSGVYATDRFFVQAQAGTVNSSRSTTAPTGFLNSLGVTVATGASPSAGSVGVIYQGIEGFNVADLGWGTASAQTVTISFWVRSSVTGTYGLSLRNNALNRCFVSTYTVSAANTWEYKTVSIVGDTSGTWLTDNGAGIYLSFDIGEGSSRSTSTTGSWITTNTPGLASGVKLCATTGATFYITGVQLEKGSTATSFDYRPYGTELALCQRYLPAFNGAFPFAGGAYSGSTTLAYSSIAFPVQTRVPATGLSVSSAGHFRYNNGTNNYVASAVSFIAAGDKSGWVSLTTSGISAGNLPGLVDCNNASGQLLFTGCEL